MILQSAGTFLDVCSVGPWGIKVALPIHPLVKPTSFCCGLLCSIVTFEHRNDCS
uniref:Uncharacterized protein n=1 Tax=Anguilla anguilla TaxID=7936 RepID=A0A0E9RU20_ANGAN